MYPAAAGQSGRMTAESRWQNENQILEAGEELVPQNWSSSIVWLCFGFRENDVKQEQFICKVHETCVCAANQHK